MELQDVSDDTVFVGESFRIQVRVSGGGKNTGDVSIVGLDKVSIDGRSRSTSISMINSKFISDNVYVYDVHAVTKGSLKLGPAWVVEGNDRFESEKSFTLHVKKRKPDQSVAKQQREKRLQNKIDTHNQKADLFCELRVDKSDVVVGEPVLLHVDIYTHGNILQVGMQPPQFPGFLSKPIEQERKRQEEIGEKVYTVIEKRFLLYPLQVGIKTINPINIVYKIPMMQRRRGVSFFDDNFFSGFLGAGAQTKQTSSNSLHVEVQELPKSSMPVDGVGSFTSYVASVDKKEPIMNEPILLTLQIEGVGNLEQISVPRLQLPQFCKFYESKTHIKDSGLTDVCAGKKIFEFVVQVGKVGTCVIPAQTFHYFDTDSRQYQTLRTQQIELQVKVPPSGVETDRTRPETYEEEKKDQVTQEVTFKKDIHFIKEGLFSIARQRRSPLVWWIFLIFLCIPFLFYYKGMFVSVILLLRSKLFGRYIAKKSLYRFSMELKQIISKQQIQGLYSFFLRYFAAKCNVAQNVVNEEFMELHMKEWGIEERKIVDFLSFLNECASVSFATKLAKGVDSKKLLEKSRFGFYILESGD
jgi:hypothetical protein